MKDIPVVMFHSVNSCAAAHPMKPLMNSEERFEAYLKTFHRRGYQILSMDDLLSERYDPARPFCVFTFDDGFQDNLICALPLLKKYDAHATIFINTDYVSQTADETTPYGFMTREQWKQASDSGVFDLQSHTLTHEFIFSSDRLVDVYTKDKFSQYYWLAWMLFPESVQDWGTSAASYAERIPEGYPVFEYTRRLSAPAFHPNPAFVEVAVQAYQRGERDLLALGALAAQEGRMESEEEFEAIARRYLVDCKRDLEAVTGKTVHTVCFPGGGYTERVLELAREAGYRCYMRASRLREGCNFEHLRALREGEFVGLNRMSFSMVSKKPFSDGFVSRIVSAITLSSYQQSSFFVFCKKMLRRLR